MENEKLKNMKARMEERRQKRLERRERFLKEMHSKKERIEGTEQKNIEFSKNLQKKIQEALSKNKQ